jgi:hypothetical protein
MRTAAGLLMVFIGMTTVLIYVATLSHYGLPDYDLPPLPLTLFIIDSAVFVTTAGVFCLTRRYWKVCFSSALLLFLIMIYWMIDWKPLGGYPEIRDSVFVILVGIGGILPIIFVCLRKREWSESQA